MAGKDHGDGQVLVTAKRALGVGKFYMVYAVVIGLGVLFLLNPTYINVPSYSNPANYTPSNLVKAGSSLTNANVKAGLPLLAVPFSVLPMMMLATPMVILFAYDKNNGVLEYLISLGLSQKDIYMRYLKAALLIAVCYLIIFGILNLVYSYIQFGTRALQTMLLVLGISAVMAVSTVAFIITMMMIFSSLQKPRAGGNQPMAMTLGLVGVIPGYFIPFVFPYHIAIEVEILQAVIIAAVAIALTMLSGKLIRREKLLP